MQYLDLKSHLQVFKATKQDLPVLVELEKICFATSWSSHCCELEIEQAQVWLLYLADQAIGYASLSLCDHSAELRRLAVKPGWRRQGYGRYLLKNVIAIAENHGAKELLLEVSEKNQAALNLYYSLGFIAYHYRKNYYSDSAALCLRLALSPFKKI